MKFTEGQWAVKAKHQFMYPKQVFDVKFDGSEMAVYTYTKPVEIRGQTLDQGIFVLQFTACRSDAIIAKIIHYEGIRKRGPEKAWSRDSGDRSESYASCERRITF